MNRYKIITFLLLNIIFSQTVVGQNKTLHETILNRVRQDLITPAQQAEIVTSVSKSMLGNGSWADINYDDRTMVKWMPSDHFKRLKVLVMAYLDPKSPSFASDGLYDNIIKGLTFWYQKDAKSDNWWHNEIDVPQLLGQYLILMRGGKMKVHKDLETKLLDRMDRGDMIARTGANKTDIALHVFYRSLLSGNNELLELSIAQLFSPLRQVHYGEGLQYDGSYLQHGPQLYIGGYGAVYINGILKLASYVQDTPYALSSTKLKLFSDFYRNTYLKTIRGSYADFNIQGRGLSRLNTLNRKGDETSRLRLSVKVDPENTPEWEAARKRLDGEVTPSYQVVAGHKHFWNGDYTIHLRPEYSFNVRIASNRTRRSESGNNENLIGRYLSDGATNIQLRGPEYYNIMPVWEWDKIPGTTSPDYTEDSPIPKDWGEPGLNSFAGGVSDGIYGATAYDLDYDGLSAKKSWFFFDKEIVCLGAGIKSSNHRNVVTTVNQCWLNGRVEIINASKPVKTVVGPISDGLVWHDGIGYYFPNKQNIVVSAEQQKGAWYRINKSGSKDEISAPVFKLFIEHSQKAATPAEYSYMVFPTMDQQQIKAFKVRDLKILVNNEAVQAVFHSKLNIFQAVFYKAGTIKLERFSASVDKPCLLMIKNWGTDKVEITYADPLQKERAVEINIKDLKSGAVTKRNFDFPLKEFSGSSRTVELN